MNAISPIGDNHTVLGLSAPVWEGDIATFAKSFIAAQKAMDAIKKARENSHFGSKYADLAACVEAVLPALNEHGIGVMQFPFFDGQAVNVTTTLLHESGASVTATLMLKPSKQDPQGVGSATTYGRRYALLAMTGVAPEDDDGNATSGPRQQEPPPKPEEHGIFIAAKAAIDLCNDDRAALQRWAEDNKASMAKIGAENGPVHDAIARYWKDKLRAAPKPACVVQGEPTQAKTTPQPQTDEFGLNGDDVPAFS